MTLGLAVTLFIFTLFRTFLVLGYFWTLHSSTDKINSGIHQNVRRLHCQSPLSVLHCPCLVMGSN